MEFFLCKDHYGMCEEEKKTLEDKMSVLACERWRECWLKIRKRILLSKNKKQKKKRISHTEHRNETQKQNWNIAGQFFWLFNACLVVCLLLFWHCRIEWWFFFLNENWSNWKYYFKKTFSSSSLLHRTFKCNDHHHWMNWWKSKKFF